MGRAHRVDRVGGRFHVDVGPAGDDHGVGLAQPLQSMVGLQVLAPDSPAPAAVDERGRSAQTCLVDVVVRSGGRERRAVAKGRDIYAVGAPLAVEAVHRILAGRTRTVGVASAGALFDAAGFLRALSPHISFDLSEWLGGDCASEGQSPDAVRRPAGHRRT